MPGFPTWVPWPDPSSNSTRRTTPGCGGSPPPPSGLGRSAPGPPHRDRSAADSRPDRGPPALRPRHERRRPVPYRGHRGAHGVPVEDPDRFAHLGSVVGLALDGVTSATQMNQLAHASAELADLFTRLAGERDRRPGDDVVGRLATAWRDGSSPHGSASTVTASRNTSPSPAASTTAWARR